MDQKLIDLLKKASASFLKRHNFEEGMAIRFKPELLKTDDSSKYATFMYWLPNSFSGNSDHPLDDINFLIADCVIMSIIEDKPKPILFDSRFLEPVIEVVDDSQLQLELPLDAKK